jgi:7-carboxy-7-deazaguanine synthase
MGNPVRPLTLFHFSPFPLFPFSRFADYPSIMDLRITEIFLSVQGESSHAGRPCSFVRLTGCPMRCVWCDSEYTFTGGERLKFDDIFAKLNDFGCRLVEVTGGEPLAQKNVFPFISELCDRGYEVLIETGGFVSTEAVDLRATIILDVKCPASGESERNHWPNLGRLNPAKDEVKFVVADLNDLEFAYRIINEYDLANRAKELLISPVFGLDNLAEIAEAVSRSGLKIRLNLQLHKFVWGSDARGV